MNSNSTSSSSQNEPVENNDPVPPSYDTTQNEKLSQSMPAVWASPSPIEGTPYYRGNYHTQGERSKLFHRRYPATEAAPSRHFRYFRNIDHKHEKSNKSQHPNKTDLRPRFLSPSSSRERESKNSSPEHYDLNKSNLSHISPNSHSSQQNSSHNNINSSAISSSSADNSKDDAIIEATKALEMHQLMADQDSLMLLKRQLAAVRSIKRDNTEKEKKIKELNQKIQDLLKYKDQLFQVKADLAVAEERAKLRDDDAKRAREELEERTERHNSAYETLQNQNRKIRKEYEERISELESQNSNMEATITTYDQQIKNYEKEMQKLKRTLDSRNRSSEEQNNLIADLEQRLHNTEQELYDERHQNDDLSANVKRERSQIRSLENQLYERDQNASRNCMALRLLASSYIPLKSQVSSLCYIKEMLERQLDASEQNSKLLLEKLNTLAPSKKTRDKTSEKQRPSLRSVALFFIAAQRLASRNGSFLESGHYVEVNGEKVPIALPIGSQQNVSFEDMDSFHGQLNIPSINLESKRSAAMSLLRLESVLCDDLEMPQIPVSIRNISSKAINHKSRQSTSSVLYSSKLSQGEKMVHSIRNKISSLETHNHQTENYAGKLEKELNIAEEKQRELSNSLNEVQQSLQHAEQRNQELEEDRQSLNSKIQHHERKIETMRRKNHEQKESHQEHRQQIKELKDKLEQFDSELSNREQDISRLNDLLKKRGEEIATLEEQKRSLNGKIKKTYRQWEEEQKRNQQLSEQLRNSQNNEKSLSDQLDRYASEASQLRQVLDETREHAQSLQAEVQELQDKEQNALKERTEWAKARLDLLNMRAAAEADLHVALKSMKKNKGEENEEGEDENTEYDSENSPHDRASLQEIRKHIQNLDDRLKVARAEERVHNNSKSNLSSSIRKTKNAKSREGRYKPRSGSSSLSPSKRKRIPNKKLISSSLPLNADFHDEEENDNSSGDDDGNQFANVLNEDLESLDLDES
eukprot:gb/GECH01000909.1/.p1 GENE.gb/GECH01000909.1/~~gb/GECH01000909.1/.p1  ORF type:complete len:983 (+),score=296.72 gb/GECH01000909.1/:1-2949(+)